MPFYRIDGMTVHMRGTKLPPACVAGIGLAAPAGKEPHPCMAISGFLCDWPTAKGRTCDRALCDAHAMPVGKNKHYCPEHFAQHKDAAHQIGLFTSLIQK